ncbi:MAG: proton-conducting transporter membrane subunit, partial [Myxococcota bacterium]
MSGNIGDLTALLPLGVLFATAVLLLMYEVFAEQGERSYAAQLTVVGFGLAICLTAARLDDPVAYVFGKGAFAPLVVDSFSRVAMLVLMAGGAVATLISPAYARHAGHAHGEYYALIVFSVVGMAVMVMAGDLFTFFLGLETMSIAVYALTGLRQNDPRAPEAALKYFLMGAFATGFLLFGITFVYGATGSVTLSDLYSAVRPDFVQREDPMLTLGLILVIIGFSFKVAAVPFHMWAPDTYEGAPTPVTGFMAVGVKAAAFISLL